MRNVLTHNVSIFLVPVLISLFTNLQSQTIIKDKSTLSGEWSLAGSPYLISGEAVIPVGVELIINPGCKIVFKGSQGENCGFLKVRGILKANGTKNKHIQFTSEGGNGICGGLFYLNSVKNNSLDFCDFSFTGSIKNIDDEYTSNAAITFQNSSAKISNCTFYNSHNGVVFRYSSPHIENSIFYNHKEYAIQCLSQSKPVINGVTIVNNKLGGIYSEYAAPDISNSIIWNKNSCVFKNSFLAKLNYCLIMDDEFMLDINYHSNNLVDIDPEFVDPDRYDFGLQLNSPCIGKGENNSNIGAAAGNLAIIYSSGIVVPPSIAPDSASDKTPPAITIYSPLIRQGIKQTDASEIEISGITRDDSGIQQLKINNVFVSVDKNGVFTHTIPLKAGENRIIIESTDLLSNTTTEIYSINRTISSGKYYALLIAVNEYTDENINDLDNPLADANRLYKVLEDQYLFATSQIIILRDPTRNTIIDVLDSLVKVITPNDNLLIFYAGHGYWDNARESGYWLPADARKDSRANWIQNSTIQNYIKDINSKHTLLIADACFGGGIFKTRNAFNEVPESIERLFYLPSRKAMTSGMLNEVPDKSVFTEYFIDRLEANDEKYITSLELFTSIRVAVMNNSDNIPQFGTIQKTGDEGGDFLFILK